MDALNNPYKRAMIAKLVAYDWSKMSFNSYSSFFDDAYTLIESDGRLVERYLEMKSDFESRYGLTIEQAEAIIWTSLSGDGRRRRLVKRPNRHHESMSCRKRPQDRDSREVHFLEMLKDLREIKRWFQIQVKEQVGGMGLEFFDDIE